MKALYLKKEEAVTMLKRFKDSRPVKLSKQWLGKNKSPEEQENKELTKSLNKRSAGRFGLHNLTIGWKYGFILIFIFILLVIATTLVAFAINDSQEDMEVLMSDADRAVLTIELSDMINAKGLSAMGYAQFRNQSNMDNFEAKNVEIDEQIAILQEEFTNENQIGLFNQVVQYHHDLTDIFYDEIVAEVDAAEEVKLLYTNRYNIITENTGVYLEGLRDLIIEDRDQAAEHAETSQNRALVMLLASMVVSIIVAFVLVILISRYVTKHLTQVVNMSDQIASGDLTASDYQYQGKDEIGQLATSMNKMRAQLTTMIDAIKQTSLLVSTQSEQLNQSAEDVNSGNQQIAATMEELASGTETQANFSGDLAETMIEFAEKIKSINKSSESINESSNEVLQETTLGNEYMNKSINQMNNIDQIVKDAVAKVEGLDNQTQEISQLVGVVKDIASQTNLLALNAAIEAARAGEHGLGFAVVADEVRKLAEQVADSVVGIAKIVDEIQSESKAVSAALEQGYDEVAQGTEDIEETGVRFKAIEEAISIMTENVQTVMAGLDELNNDSGKVNEAVQEIASISEESAAGVEQTSASAEEASSAMEGVANGASTLLDSAKELSDLVQQFKM